MPEPDQRMTGLGFKPEVWDRDGQNCTDLLAAAYSYALIKVAYDAAVTSRPKDRLLVRQGLRVVLGSGPPDPDKAGNVVALR